MAQESCLAALRVLLLEEHDALLSLGFDGFLEASTGETYKLQSSLAWTTVKELDLGYHTGECIPNHRVS